MQPELYGLTPTTITLIIIAVVWSSVWKAFALYRAGKQTDPIWFVLLFLVNTLGILEMFYLFIFSRRASRVQQQSAHTAS